MAPHNLLAGLDPLKDLLGDVISRLEALESKEGITPTTAAGEPIRRASVTTPPAPTKLNLAGMSVIL